MVLTFKVPFSSVPKFRTRQFKVYLFTPIYSSFSSKSSFHEMSFHVARRWCECELRLLTNIVSLRPVSLSIWVNGYLTIIISNSRGIIIKWREYISISGWICSTFPNITSKSVTEPQLLNIILRRNVLTVWSTKLCNSMHKTFMKLICPPQALSWWHSRVIVVVPIAVWAHTVAVHFRTLVWS